jgi:O-antigen ligase
MFKNLQIYKLNQEKIIKILFYIYPLVMLMPSGYINAYLGFFLIWGYVHIFANQIKIKIFFVDYVIFTFFTVSIISTIINYEDSNYIILGKSIADIRFALLFLLIRNLFYNKIIKINLFLISSLWCVVFLSLDILLQFTYGKDILGYPELDGRYGGVFGKEAIAGGYIQKFSMFAILASFFLTFKNIKNNKLFIIFVILIFANGILMSLDRIPFIIYIVSLLLLLILLKNYRKILVLSILIIIFFFLILYKNNDLINKRYSPVYNLFQITISQMPYLKDSKNKDEKNFEQRTISTGIFYYKLFTSAMEVSKDNLWVGSGTKSYHKSCVEQLLKYNKNLLCAPHPHNIYLEILINQGVIGLIIFLTFLFFLIRNYYLNLTLSKINNSCRLLNIFFLTFLILELFPIRSYGSIFQTVNGTMFWFMISLISSNRWIVVNDQYQKKARSIKY